MAPLLGHRFAQRLVNAKKGTRGGSKDRGRKATLAGRKGGKEAKKASLFGENSRGASKTETREVLERPLLLQSRERSEELVYHTG